MESVTQDRDPGERQRWSRGIIWLACLLLIFAAGVPSGGLFETSANAVFDAYQRLSPPPSLTSPIVVVAVDDASLHRVGQWPWRRDQLARLIDAVSGARAVGLDILLTEPDRTSPGVMIADWPNLPAQIKTALAALPEPDAILAESMARAPVVLAAAATDAIGENPASSPVAMLPIFEAGDGLRTRFPRYSSAEWPLPQYLAASRAIGLVSRLSEPDGVTRRIPAIFEVGSALMPSFSIEMVCIAENIRRIGISFGPGGSRQLQIGNHRITIDGAGRAWPAFRRHVLAPTISAYRVLDGEIPASQFQGRIVLIGVAAAGLGDIVVTPLRHAEPGIIFQAQLIDSILTGDVLWRPPLAKAGELLAALILGVAALTSLAHLSDRVYGFLFGGLTLVGVLGSYAAFRSCGLLLDWTFPLSALLGTMLVALVLRVGDEVRMRRRKERQLVIALHKAEAADRAKSEFLANASHELRTPLTAILGFSEIMSEEILGPLPEKYAEYAHDIHETATHLHTIISDMLDLVVIDLGGKAPADEPIDIVKLVSECAHMMRSSYPMAETAHITTSFSPGMPRLRADPQMVKQMLINLLSNAIKYSPSGGEVSIRAEIGDDTGLTIAVTDHGVGMAPEDIPFATKPFGRLRPARLAQPPGIGIGLPLTKSMIELHGGTLVLKSQLGLGTTAILWFPSTRFVVPEEPL